ncbi:MAG TPA: hypothetical protein VKH35_05690 [Thermoanaerobaculia bacterium]|nr:hypothetical protein [Thermoanaerobaculia bacterium]
MALVVFLFVPMLAWAQPRLDQEQVNLDTSQVLALGGSSAEKLAQVFTIGRDGFIADLTLPMTCEPAATVTVRIEQTSAGVPSGVSLGAEDVPGTVFTSVPTPAIGFRIVEFRHPVRVSAGVQYALTLEAAGGSCGVWIGPVGHVVAGGSAFFDARPNPPGWLELFDNNGQYHDLAFQVFTVDSRSGR